MRSRGGRAVDARWMALVAFVLLAIPMVPATRAEAATEPFVWQPQNFSRVWSNAENWAGSVAPSPADGEVDLEFPLGPCLPEERCWGTTDDLGGLRIGTLTLDARVVRFSGGAPLELPPAHPAPLAYEVSGSQQLRLARGLVVDVSEVGAGEGVIGTGGTAIDEPVELVGTNVWSVGPAPEQLHTSAVSGPHPLTVLLGFDDSLGMNAPIEVGPLKITGQQNSYAYDGSGGDLNGEDGEPVSIEGSSVRLGGRTGPLTLERSRLEIGGSPPFAGPLSVAGAMSLDAGSALDLGEPYEGAPFPTVVKASGPVDLGGAHLRFEDPCPVPGASFTLIEAAGVEGGLTSEGGEPISDGTVLPGDPNGCGSGRPSVGVRFSFTATKVIATALEAIPQTTTGGSEGASKSPGANDPGADLPAGRSGIAAFSTLGGPWLGSDLKGPGSRTRIGRLLRAGGSRLRVNAPTAGLLSITWTVRRGHRSIVLATGTLRFVKAGSGMLHLRLTRAGRALLHGEDRVRVEAKARFAYSAGPPFVAYSSLELTR